MNVYIPRDKLTKKHTGYGFVEFQTEMDAEYAIKIMNQVKLYGEPLKVKKSSRDKTYDVGAKLFIGNLDPEVDEEFLYHTFSAFGLIVSTTVMRDETTGVSKGYAFLSFDNFEAADAAIETMNGQFVRGRRINVQYALKKDSKNERHGSQAERYLAKHNPLVEQRKHLQQQTLGQDGSQYPAPYPMAPPYGPMMFPPQYPPPMQGYPPPPPTGYGQ